MGVCVCVNVLCGIVRKESFVRKTSRFFPSKRKIFFKEIKRGSKAREI